MDLTDEHTCTRTLLYDVHVYGLKADESVYTSTPTELRILNGHLFLLHYQQNPYKTITSLQLRQPPDISSHYRIHTPQL